jgi:putative nucleotidyltransferase with HDIG domain
MSPSMPPFHTLIRVFLRHVESLSSPDARIRAHFELKIRHTFRVVRNITEIARNEKFSEPVTELARVIGLLHDIGRFRQFVKYGTFDDSISMNHAEYGVQILEQEGMLNAFGDRESDLIKRAILQHNIPAINDTADPEVIRYAMLIRDADKSDIWKITAETNVMYSLNDGKPDENYTIPQDILESYRENHVIRVEKATCLNDTQLVRLAWIFDMNFAATFNLLLNKGHADAILAKLPPSEIRTEIGEIIHRYMMKRAAEPPAGISRI